MLKIRMVEKVKLKEDFKELSGHLSRVFQSDVQFRINDQGRGKIVIQFDDSDEMERILGLLDRLNS